MSHFRALSRSASDRWVAKYSTWETIIFHPEVTSQHLLFPVPGTAACSDCLSGEYFNINEDLGIVNCSSCPQGYSCAGACSDPVACTPGFYQAAVNQNSCDACPTGYYNIGIGASSCTQCPEGYSCADNITLPEICIEGFYSQAGATSCSPCLAGSYADTKGSTSCTICPVGHACPTASSGKRAFLFF